MELQKIWLKFQKILLEFQKYFWDFKRFESNFRRFVLNSKKSEDLTRSLKDLSAIECLIGQISYFFFSHMFRWMDIKVFWGWNLSKIGIKCSTSLKRDSKKQRKKFRNSLSSSLIILENILKCVKWFAEDFNKIILKKLSIFSVSNQQFLQRLCSHSEHSTLLQCFYFTKTSCSLRIVFTQNFYAYKSFSQNTFSKRERSV